MPKKIVVFGGTGFLGSRICHHATTRSWTVLSLSRSGTPHWPSISSSPNPPSWSTSVSWEKGDILQPSTYAHLLKDADCVVHSMGILLEADYKGVLQGRESPIAGLRKAFSKSKAGSRGNPLERDVKSGEGVDVGADGVTYELINRDSAITLAQEASQASIPSCVYISAAAGTPILPSRYITTKREAESTIASSFPKIRSIFMRPGFLYDSSRTFTMPIAFFGAAGNMVNSMLGGRLTPLVGAAVEKPLKADLVAEAVVEAIEDESVKGVIATEAIEALATKSWRRGML